MEEFGWVELVLAPEVPVQVWAVREGVWLQELVQDAGRAVADWLVPRKRWAGH